MLQNKDIIHLIKELINASYYKGLCDGLNDYKKTNILQQDIEKNYAKVKELHIQLLKLFKE